jgi:hypothetical protein
MLGTIKHSKYKNTGILFELLVRQITADTLSGRTSKAVDLLKKHFVNSELGKEYKLYETLLKTTKLPESKANLVLETLVETSKKLNKKLIRTQKYNLIKEIKQVYDLEEFFKTKLPNYKTQAAFSILLEAYSTQEMVHPDQIIQNKVTILEHLTTKTIDTSKVQQALLEEFQGYDADLRILTYRILLEKFNGKYASLTSDQKEVLQEFVTSVDSDPKLKEVYNTRVSKLIKELKQSASIVSNQVVKIKLQEVIKLIKPLEKNAKATNEDLINLLHYYELLNEVRKTHG